MVLALYLGFAPSLMRMLVKLLQSRVVVSMTCGPLSAGVVWRFAAHAVVFGGARLRGVAPARTSREGLLLRVAVRVPPLASRVMVVMFMVSPAGTGRTA